MKVKEAIATLKRKGRLAGKKPRAGKIMIIDTEDPVAKAAAALHYAASKKYVTGRWNAPSSALTVLP